jgi:hypothetical protein
MARTGTTSPRTICDARAEPHVTDAFDAMPWHDDFERSDARTVDRNRFRDNRMLR